MRYQCQGTSNLSGAVCLVSSNAINIMHINYLSINCMTWNPLPENHQSQTACRQMTLLTRVDCGGHGWKQEQRLVRKKQL